MFACPPKDLIATNTFGKLARMHAHAFEQSIHSRNVFGLRTKPFVTLMSTLSNWMLLNDCTTHDSSAGQWPSSLVAGHLLTLHCCAVI